MEIIGKTTLHPVIFYSGKFAGYSTWVIYAFSLGGVQLLACSNIYYNNYISFATLLLGLFFTSVSLINLGKSTRLGLPTESTQFKNNGLYKISRNPMYVGFNLITLAAIIYCLNIFVAILGVYSMFVYHNIIKKEEHFLENLFGEVYKTYKSKVRRYL